MNLPSFILWILQKKGISEENFRYFVDDVIGDVFCILYMLAGYLLADDLSFESFLLFIGFFGVLFIIIDVRKMLYQKK